MGLNPNNSRPERLSGARAQGQRWLSNADLDQLVRTSQIRSANSNLTVYRDGHGWVIDAGAPRLVPVKIVSGTGEDHVADIYANGKDAALTENDAAIKVLDIGASTSIAANTWLSAWLQVWDNGGVNQTYWTVAYTVPGGGGICVQITSQVDYQHYMCSVFGNGYRDDLGNPVAATETGKHLWIDQIAAGSTIPTGTRLRATKIGTHYEADVPRWL